MIFGKSEDKCSAPDNDPGPRRVCTDRRGLGSLPGAEWCMRKVYAAFSTPSMRYRRASGGTKRIQSGSAPGATRPVP